MIRRGLITVAATAGIAAAASGCGGSSAKSPLDDALGYLPKTTPVAIAVKTDLKDPQYHSLDTLLKRFPFYTLIKQRLAAGFTIGGTKTSFAEVKELLGNDLVIGFPHAASGSSLSSATVVAWKTKDGKKAATLVGRTGRKVGSENGATLYEEANGNVDAIKGDVLVSAKSRPLVDAALKQRGSSDRLREDTFKSALSGLPTDAIVRVYGDFQRLLSSGRAAAAKRVPWVGALRTFGSTVTSASDGLVIDFRAKTQGSLSSAQLPLAAGSTAPKIVRRPHEVAVALRDPGQTVRFAEQAFLAAVPQGALGKAAIERALGINFDRDLIAPLGAGAAASVSLTGNVVARVDLKDPAAFKKTLSTLSRNLPKASNFVNGLTLQPGPNGLYQLKPRGAHRPEFVGVSGKELVIGTDPGQAIKFGSERATTATGANGALAFALDPRSILGDIIKRRGGQAGALFGGAFVAPLRDLTGYASVDTSGLSSHLKLTIAR